MEASSVELFCRDGRVTIRGPDTSSALPGMNRCDGCGFATDGSRESRVVFVCQEETCRSGNADTNGALDSEIVTECRTSQDIAGCRCSLRRRACGEASTTYRVAP